MLKLGYRLTDRTEGREVYRSDDEAIDWDGSTEEAKQAYRDRFDCSGLTLKGEPTRWKVRVLTSQESAGCGALGGFVWIQRMVLAARCALELPGYEWTDGEGVVHQGLPREQTSGLSLVRDDWWRQNIGTVHELFAIQVGRMALGDLPTEIEKKA